MKHRDITPPPRSSKLEVTACICQGNFSSARCLRLGSIVPGSWPADVLSCGTMQGVAWAVNSGSTARTSLAALDGVFAPAPHALAEALEELPCALVPALALLAAGVAPAAHALAQVVIACKPE